MESRVWFWGAFSVRDVHGQKGVEMGGRGGKKDATQGGFAPLGTVYIQFADDSRSLVKVFSYFIFASHQFLFQFQSHVKNNITQDLAFKILSRY